MFPRNARQNSLLSNLIKILKKSNIKNCSSSSSSSTSSNSTGAATSQGAEIELPPEPTTCCMSGCNDCVWIAYAEELVKLFEGNSEEARRVLLEKIQDPTLKMFLMMELNAKMSK